MPTKVFFVIEQGDVQLYLRRYTSSSERKCLASGSYCNANLPFGRVKAERDADGYYRSLDRLKPPHDDPRWPKTCAGCGREFGNGDPFQLFQDAVMVAADGREFLRRELPPGACYDAWWYGEHMQGPDGRHLIVILPNGREWCIDARASNCTKPGDDVHRCWVRHGRPEDGTLHVDKNGNTCAAGAGSIAVPGYHGFLHHGHLSDG